jgi:hypothetical protein
MKKRMLTAFIVGMLVAGSVRAESDYCSVGMCGVNTTTAGLWVQLSGTSQGSQIPSNTWTTCASTDPIVINRMLAVFLLAKSMGSPVWVQGIFSSGILNIDTVVIP